MLKSLGKYVHQSWLVVFCCAGIVAGVILGLVFRASYFWSPVWVVFGVLALVLAYFRPRIGLLALVFLAGVILALFRIANELDGEGHIKQFVGQKVIVAGVVSGDPETDEAGMKIKLTQLEFGENGEYPASGSMFISLRANHELRRLDKVKLEGRLAEGFGVYAGYMYRPVVLEVWRPEPGDLVLRVRDWFAERIRRLVPSPEVDLGLSYLLGMKAGLGEDLSENLRVVGLVHIVVASGAHLSILVEIARKVFGKLSRFSALLFSLLFVAFFMAMVGWTPSILRAGIMSIMTLMAWYVGRKIAPWRIILTVAAFTLILNPMFIINLGWLLSFASFGGIMILGPRLVRFFYGEKKPGFVGEIIVTTMAATLMTLPIILYFYGTMSLISVVANLLILPTLSFAMGLVFLTGVVSGVAGIEAVVPFAATKLLSFHIAVVEFFGGMKSFLFKMEAGQAAVFLIYGLILTPLVILEIRKVFRLTVARKDVNIKKII